MGKILTSPMPYLSMVSILIVNYNSLKYLKSCIESIRNYQDNLSVEIIVVDSGSKKEERESIAKLNSKGIKVYINDTNVGYAKGNNQAFSLSKGEFILVLNPDTKLLDNALNKMVSYLKDNSKVAAVTPRIWWDDDKLFQLPPSLSITFWETVMIGLALSNHFVRNLMDKWWLKKELDYWQAKKAMEISTLSGACFLTRRSILKKYGFFDEGFPLYFEDNDWCKRLKKNKEKLIYLPSAEIIHYYNQTTTHSPSDAQEKFAFSMRRFFLKHYGKKTTNLLMKLLNFFSSHPAKWEGKDLGILSLPFEFNMIKEKGPYLVQISPNPHFIPSVGAFTNSLPLRLSNTLWSSIAKGTYFSRIITLNKMKIFNNSKWYKL